MSRKWVGPVLVLAMLAFALAVYGRLPDRIPTHWNLHGQVNGWLPRWPGAFFWPALAAALWFLIPLLRRIDPRRANYERFDETFWLMVNLVVLLLAALEVVALGRALGWPLDVRRVAPVLLGLVFAIVGNYLPRIRSNWWMGIRTPWTLSSDRVWRETQRVGGRSFVVAGLLSMLAAALPEPWSLRVMIGVLVVGTLVPLVYSYFSWRADHRA